MTVITTECLQDSFTSLHISKFKISISELIMKENLFRFNDNNKH